MATRNLADVSDRTRVSGEEEPWNEDIEVSFEDSPQASTRVGMLPPGVGVRGRVSWLSARWLKWTKAHTKRIGACFAILVIAGAAYAIGAEAMSDAVRLIASRDEPARTTTNGKANAKAKPAAITRAPAKKKTVTATAAPRRATTASAKKATSSKVSAGDWKPVATARPKTTPSSDLVSAGHIYMRSGKLSAAEDAYREALRENKSDGEARFWLATAESSQGKKWRACRNFKKYLEDFPAGRHAHDARTNVAACD